MSYENTQISTEKTQIDVEQINRIEAVVLFPIARYDTDPSTYTELCKTVRRESHGGIKVDLGDLAYGMISVRWNRQNYSRLSLDDVVKRVFNCVYKTDKETTDEEDM